MFYQSDNEDLLIAKLILGGCFGVIFLFSVGLFVESYLRPKNPKTALSRFFLLMLQIEFFGIIYIVSLIGIFADYFGFPKIIILVISCLPCTAFILSISRIVYEFTDLSFTFSSIVGKREKYLMFLKKFLWVYCIASYLSRMAIVAFVGNSATDHKDKERSLAFISIFFSASSFCLLILSFWNLQRRFGTVFTNDQGKAVKKSVKTITVVLVFVIFSYWISAIIGFTCFDNAKVSQKY